MSKQSRLNKEKAARAKANQDQRSSPQPQQGEVQRNPQQERDAGNQRRDDKRQ